ncbi:hypothetical protein CAEBREN_22742 [Caenorhabditis brenneri]|uniref:Uncharacterized protein n=1 Tax=Caenorhabditis brenneri TaxID=135651 RepID=G0PEX2_CAEBE|nr:hypothetical protein CAEBREN_22742 [Caenorhabditis brenneri]
MDLLEDDADENMDFGHESEVMPMESIAVKRGRKPKPRRGDSYKMYDKADVVEFIRHVESREELWNSRNDNWHRKESKMAGFGQVEQECKRFMSYSARAVDSLEQAMKEEMEKTRQVFREVFCDPSSTSSSCQSERVCKFFQDVTKNMNFIDKIETESKVIAFMASLKSCGITDPTRRSASSSMQADPYSLQSNSDYLDFENYR